MEAQSRRRRVPCQSTMLHSHSSTCQPSLAADKHAVVWQPPYGEIAVITLLLHFNSYLLGHAAAPAGCRLSLDLK